MGEIIGEGNGDDTQTVILTQKRMDLPLTVEKYLYVYKPTMRPFRVGGYDTGNRVYLEVIPEGSTDVPYLVNEEELPIHNYRKLVFRVKPDDVPDNYRSYDHKLMKVYEFATEDEGDCDAVRELIGFGKVVVTIDRVGGLNV